jgi:probable HAF family extracellular repeat protein
MKLIYRCSGRVLRTLLLVPTFLATCASAAPANLLQYSVINLAPGSGVALLNQRGQAGFTTYSSGAMINGFFDGRQVHRVGPAGAGDTVVSGLNDLGVVVGQFNDAATPAPFNYRAFSWSVAGGLRALPGPGQSMARAINRLNQAVGSTKGDAFYGRAYRWNPDGTAFNLGPLPASLSEAIAINDSGVAVGYADVARYDSHAVVWDANGNATDLGTLGGTQSVATHINVHGQVLGSYYRDSIPGGFLWSRTGGIVKIMPEAPMGVRVAALNDNGDVAANLQVVDDNGNYAYTPMLWSLARGGRALPLGGAAHGSVDALNNRGGMVGYLERKTGDVSNRRAVLWSGAKTPLDLNLRIHHAPAGLVLHAGKAINDQGDILADSNAGLVLLRPGTQGSAAPVLGPVVAPGDVLPLGAVSDLSVAFTDTGASETHLASASVDDGCPSEAPVVREARGNGEINLRHVFCQPGSFTVKVKVTDRAGNATEVHRLLSVGDTAAAQARRRAAR